MDNRIRSIVEGGLAVGLATVLSMVSIYRMPQGGSVTAASMAPLILYSISWGIGRGFIVGGLYGLIDFLTAPYFFSPMQFILDYILAYALLGIAGIIRNKKFSLVNVTLASIIAISLRGICHILSGVIFFSEYAGSQNPWIYSTIYNFSYLIPEMLITIIVILLLHKPLSNILNRSAE